jgi:hypothetical protein
MRFRFLGLIAASGALLAAPFPPQTEKVPLESAAALKAGAVKIEPVTFKGKSCVRLTDTAPDSAGDDVRLALLKTADFQDGVIELDLAGEPAASAGPGARGFVGLAFRMAADGSRFECFYLRPTNGRADDQVRRNHSAQYISVPGFPWPRLRKEFPEKYESYVDLVPAEWTSVKIEVRGEMAKLYVHGAAQPTLWVSDLKQGKTKGGIALWVGPGTIAHFSNARVSRQ